MRYFLIAILCLVTLSSISLSFADTENNKWEGVDKTVVEKIALDRGRQAESLIMNTDQGDLLLFLFLSAGAVGGFFAGYSYRALTERAPHTEETHH